MRKLSKPGSIIINIIIYLIAILVIIYTWALLPDVHLLWKLFIADVTGTVIVFVFSVLFNNSSMYDPYWSVQPVVIALFYVMFTGTVNDPLMIIVVLVFLYGLRLTLNFYRGWEGMAHEDWRYVNFRNRFPEMYWVVSFFGIHLFPTIMVFLACLPLYGIFTGAMPAFNGWFFAGLITMTIAITLPLIADIQMRRFRKSRENHGKVMNKGLWRYSRHPNYLGEIMTWWGLFFFGLSVSYDYWWTGIGALAVTLLFLFISIPILEKRLLDRRQGYHQYQEEVPVLLPFHLPHP